jgi:hypothetical protein
MRKLLFIASIVIGALAGLLSSIKDDWATQIVMTGVGVLFGTAFGGGLRGGRGRRQHCAEIDIPGISVSMKEIANSAWRDRGHPPFTKPWDALPDRHMFDPDKHE